MSKSKLAVALLMLTALVPRRSRAGVRWMHVSNGQGLGAQNPSYEGIGFPIALSLAM